MTTAAPVHAGSPRQTHAKRVLLTSVCRPLGEKHGDGPSVGYELLHGQITRAQGIWSPRTPLSNRIQFSLLYIAENLDAPTTVLHYPSRAELIRELKQGYEFVGISFLLATFRHMKEMVALIRAHAPGTQIVLGSYGTVLGDEVLTPHADHICREEGIGFMRRLLGEPERPLPYRQPQVLSQLSVFGRRVSNTGVVFAGLGCPNGCDFCCTSHFFKRKHVRLLPTGKDVYRAIEVYLADDPETPIQIMDEDFLLNRRRAMEFRDAVVAGGRPLSVFAFASIRALSQYSIEELLEMGIDGLWIGYEGSRAGFSKQIGRPPAELFRELRDHGISILASMIIGLPYQTPEIIDTELAELLDLQPDFTQFMIYGPTPGTPFFQQVIDEGLLHRDLLDDRELYYHSCNGFTAMVNHPSMAPAEIEAAQARCFDQDFRRLGPSIFRTVETWLLGYQRLAAFAHPLLQAKAALFQKQLRRAYPVFLAGRLFGPNAASRRRIAELEARVHAAAGRPGGKQRLESLLALAAASWTWLTLRLGLFQHPPLLRHSFRFPQEPAPARAWRRLRSIAAGSHAVRVELRAQSTVWVRIEGSLDRRGTERLINRLRSALKRSENRLVLDLDRLLRAEQDFAEHIADVLRMYRERIHLVLPAGGEVRARLASAT